MFNDPNPFESSTEYFKLSAGFRRPSNFDVSCFIFRKISDTSIS